MTTQLNARLADKPNLTKIVSELLQIWPEHESYCERRFRDDPPGFLQRSEQLAALVVKLTDSNLSRHLEDYKWMCAEFVQEELYFRRHGKYRLSTFKEAFDTVYGDDTYMARYVRGILISQFIWSPHALAFDFFRTAFLPSMPKNARYLEVGPGHGLFLYFAAQEPHVAEIVAWDISQSSIAATNRAIEKLGVTKDVSLIEQDVLLAATEPDSFDGAVISEVLEHLEDPRTALSTLYSSLKPGGKVFINVPVNSPAPDHIYLWRSTEEFVDFVKSIGFEIKNAEFYPVTGTTLQRAKKQDLSISCIIIGEKPVS